LLCHRSPSCSCIRASSYSLAASSGNGSSKTSGALEENIRAIELDLSEEDVRLLDAVSDPGVPYPKWMVLQLDTAEDPRGRVLDPERYATGGGVEGPP
jgi:hypothetical protein